jgi:hypothetical protein
VKYESIGFLGAHSYLEIIHIILKIIDEKQRLIKYRNVFVKRKILLSTAKITVRCVDSSYSHTPEHSSYLISEENSH